MLINTQFAVKTAPSFISLHSQRVTAFVDSLMQRKGFAGLVDDGETGCQLPSGWRAQWFQEQFPQLTL